MVIGGQWSTGVELYYDNTKEVETTNGGVNIVGTCTATLFSGDGSGLTNVGVDTSNVRSDTVQVGVLTTTSQFYPPSLTTTERDVITFNTGKHSSSIVQNKDFKFILEPAGSIINSRYRSILHHQYVINKRNSVLK